MYLVLYDIERMEQKYIEDKDSQIIFQFQIPNVFQIAWSLGLTSRLEKAK